MSPTGTLLDTDPVIATSDFLGLLLDSPDVLQGSFEDMKNHSYRCCVYELSSDKRGLDLKSQSCGPETSGWNASEDFKAFKSLYRESKPGFGLFRVTQDTILSIMNFSHLNADPCWTRTPKDEHFATSKPCRIQDRDALPLLETQWADMLMYVFENADLFDQQWNLMISINATFTPNDSKFFSTTNHPITIIVHLKIFGNEHSLFFSLEFVSEQRQILATSAKPNLQAFWASGLDHGRRLVRKMRRVALGRGISVVF